MRPVCKTRYAFGISFNEQNWIVLHTNEVLPWRAICTNCQCFFLLIEKLYVEIMKIRLRIYGICIKLGQLYWYAAMGVHVAPLTKPFQLIWLLKYFLIFVKNIIVLFQAHSQIVWPQMTLVQKIGNRKKRNSNSNHSHKGISCCTTHIIE